MTTHDQSRLGRFLIELRDSADGYEDIEAVSARSRAACDEMAADMSVIRLVRSVFLPEDGSCLLLFEATSAPLVAEVAQRIGVASGPVLELSRT